MGIFHNHLNIVKYLVRRGAVANAPDSDGCTALGLASHRGHPEVSRFLCESGADVNAADSDGFTTLMFASDQGHLATVRYLTEQGVDLFARHQDGRTAVAFAIQANHIAVAAYLKEACIKELAETTFLRPRAVEHQGRRVLQPSSTGSAKDGGNEANDRVLPVDRSYVDHCK